MEGQRRHDESIDTYADAHALGMHIVEEICSRVEGVVIDLHAVQVPVCLDQVGEDLGGVGLGEYETDIVDIVIDRVSLNTVILLQTLYDIVLHICRHLLFRRCGEVGDEKENHNESGQNDQLPKTTVQECVFDSVVRFVIDLRHSA